MCFDRVVLGFDRQLPLHFSFVTSLHCSESLFVCFLTLRLGDAGLLDRLLSLSFGFFKVFLRYPSLFFSDSFLLDCFLFFLLRNFSLRESFFPLLVHSVGCARNDHQDRGDQPDADFLHFLDAGLPRVSLVGGRFQPGVHFLLLRNLLVEQ